MKNQHYYKVTVLIVGENGKIVSRNSWTYPTRENAVEKASQYGEDAGDGSHFDSEYTDSLLHIFDPSYPARTKTMAAINEIQFDR